MKSSARKVELASASDLFSTEQERQDAKLERVQQIPLAELYPFPDHPFSVRDDDSMKETVESIKDSGVLQPAIARPREGGGYELVSGHRRKRACELAGLDTMPVIVRDLDRDTAIIFMVDSNIQRENISPMEKAKALKMKMEAIRRQAGRPRKEQENNSPNNSANFRSDDEVGAEMGMSGDTVRNIISLTQLVPELQQMVDDKKIAMTPAVEISYLKPAEQALLVETIESEQATPSLSQAQRMKKLSQSGKLNEDTMLGIMSEEKKPEVDEFLDWLTAHGYKKAVSTAAREDRTKEHLTQVGIYDRFDQIACAPSVPHGKPMPDVYLHACEQIGEKPEHCLALEDSDNGALSAHRAGCKVVMVKDLADPLPETVRFLDGTADSLLEVIPILKRLEKEAALWQ